MQFKAPKNDSKYQWTQHVQDKMRYYAISESLIKRIIRHPKRTQEGIAESTIAAMQEGTNKKKPTEIWVMYKQLGPSGPFLPPKVRVISAWRYPGMSPVGKPIPIPDEILQELESMVD